MVKFSIVILKLIIFAYVCAKTDYTVPWEKLRSTVPEEHAHDIYKEVDRKIRSVYRSHRLSHRVNYRKDAQNVWPLGVIPYRFSQEFPYGKRERLLQAFEYINENTCLRMRPFDSAIDSDYLNLTYNMNLCYIKQHGYRKNNNVANFANYCINDKKLILQQFSHVLGFYGQQRIFYRDDYISIDWDNVNRTFKSTYEKLPYDGMTDFGFPYDFNSIMHAFNFQGAKKAGKNTMIPKKSGVKIGAKEDKFSPTDLSKVDIMYAWECKAREYYQHSIIGSIIDSIWKTKYY